LELQLYFSLQLREVILWYYKINAGIKLLEEIRDELRKINSHSKQADTQEEENKPLDKADSKPAKNPWSL
jgi:uncharacterized protein YukE